MTPLPSYAELPVRTELPPGSSWKLWGEDDRLGCLNLLTPAGLARACQEVEDGLAIPLNAALDVFSPPLFGRAPMQHDIVALDGDAGRDEMLSGLNTQCSSQWDGFRHIRSTTYGFYNGMREDELGIDNWARRGICGRGVLLDVERYRTQVGRPLAHDEPDPIEIEDLLGTLALQGTALAIGDILIINTGWLPWAADRRRTGALPEPFVAPGLRPGRKMLETLWNWHVACVAADCPAVEVWPPAALATREQRRAARTSQAAMAEVFMHSDLLALLGLPLGELWDTQHLAKACAERERWSFLFTSAPLNLSGGVASPSNATAVL